MSIVKQQTVQKYKFIHADYENWCNKKKKGVRKYTNSYIFMELSEKYFLSPRTIENIVFTHFKDI